MWKKETHVVIPWESGLDNFWDEWAFVWGCVWNLWLGHSGGEDCALFLQVLLFLVDRDLIHLEVFYPVLPDYLFLISRCPTFCSKVSILSSRNKLLSLALRDLESLLLYVFLNLEWEICCLNSFSLWFQDGKLTKEEIVDKYDLFVGSQATDFGEALVRHDEFWGGTHVSSKSNLFLQLLVSHEIVCATETVVTNFLRHEKV